MKILEKLEQYFYKVKKLGHSWNYSFGEVLADDEFHFAECWRKDHFQNQQTKFFVNSILKEFRKDLGKDIL